MNLLCGPVTPLCPPDTPNADYRCDILMKSKDIAIVGILLAVGAILRYFLAMLHTPLTPNMS